MVDLRVEETEAGAVNIREPPEERPAPFRGAFLIPAERMARAIRLAAGFFLPDFPFILLARLAGMKGESLGVVTLGCLFAEDF